MRSSCLVFFLMAVAPVFAGVAAIQDLIRGGRYADAVAACDAELKRAPGNAAYLTLRGFALRGAGDPGSALQSLRSALQSAPGYVPALQAAAQLEFESKDSHARATLETIVRLDPLNATARGMLAELEFTDGDCARALPHLAKAGRSPVNRWRQGVCLFNLERWREAAAEFSALLQLREHAPTRFNLALSHWRAGDAAAALDSLRDLDDADAASLRAAALRAGKDVPKALAVLQEAVGRYPKDERLLVELALLCLDQNAVELGVKVLEAGVVNNPESPRLRTALGVFRVRAGYTGQGEADFEQARKMAPASGLGQVATASTLMQMGMAGEAAKLLRQMPMEDPMVALTLARALHQLGEWVEARNLLARVIAKEPSNAAARSLLGRALAQNGETRAAVPQLETALRLDAADRAAAYQLVTLYKKLGRPADAARMAARVRNLLANEKAADLEAQRYQLSLTPAND